MPPSITSVQVAAADVMANAVKSSLDDVIGSYQGRKITTGGKSPQDSGLDLNDPTKFEFETPSAPVPKGKPKQSADARMQKMQSALAAQFPELENSGALARFYALLRRCQRENNTSGLAEELEKVFPDPSVRFAVVQSAASDFKQGGGGADNGDGGGDLENALAEIAAQLEANERPSIDAGNNIAPVLNRLVGSENRPDDAAAIRDFYRMAVFEFKNPADSYRCVVDHMHRFNGKAGGADSTVKDGPDLERSLSAALDFLANGLAADLAAARPSSDPARLRDVVDGLQQVRLLANAHSSCRGLMQKFHDSTRQSVPVAPYRLMSGMLEAVRNERISESEFTRMASEFNVPPLEPSINFLTQFRDIVAKLPPRTYEKPETREKVLDAMQRAIDHLIDEEEVAAG